MRNNVLSLAILWLFILPAYSQEVLSVDPLTGSLQGSIPLMTVRSKTLSYPIAASYHTNGQKPYEGTGNMGIGWNLDDSPSIVREIRDLPDELNYSGKFGWLYGGDSIVSRIINENLSDYQLNEALESLGGFSSTGDIYDTEPDLFHVRVPGHLSFSFILNSNGKPIVLSNDTHYRISFGKDDNGSISSFEILAPGNIRYSFGFSYTSSTAFEGANEEGFYWKKYYNQFEEEVFYTSDWYLTEIAASSDDKLSFDYEEFVPVQLPGGIYWYQNLTPTRNKDTIRVYSYNSNSNAYTPEYRINRNRNTAHPRELVSVRSNIQELHFERGSSLFEEGTYELESSLIDGIYLYDARSGAQIDGYTFSYHTVHSLGSGDDKYIFLKEVSQPERIGLSPLYAFDYYGIKEGKELVPNRLTKELDEFGYYAEKDNGQVLRKMYCYPDLPPSHQYRTTPIFDYADKEVVLDGFTSQVSDQRIIQAGSIRSVKTRLGGSQSVVYELNQYYDSLNQSDRYGGGIRVKSMILQDGADHSRDLIKKYTYKDPSGNSSGKLIYKPMYAAQIPIFYDGSDGSTHYYSDLLDAGLPTDELWRRMTIRSEHDLHKDEDPGYNVAYSVFTESVDGLGDRIYAFNLPYTYSSQHTIPYSNQALSEHFYNATAGSNLTKLSDNQSHYQWMMNRPHTLDYRWNGQISSMTTLSAFGDSVAASFYTYSQLGTPLTVLGLKIDQYAQKYTSDGSDELIENTFFWRPLSLPVRKEDVQVRKVDKTFSDNGASMATIIDYTYTDSLRLRSEKMTLLDGTSYTTSYTYVDDYSVDDLDLIVAAADKTALALFYLKGWWNHGQRPIESTTTYDDGSGERVIDSNLTVWETDFDLTSLSKLGTTKSYRFASKTGVTDFVPSLVSSGAFTFDDSRYELISEVKARNDENQPVASLGRGIFRSGLHYGEHGEVKLSIDGAYPEEVLFSDFEGDTEFSLDTYSQSNLTTGRVSGNALTLTAGETISGGCAKGLDSEYVVTFWVKTDQAGQVQITIEDELTNSASENVSIVGTEGGWSYVEQQLSVSTLSGNSLTVSINSPTLSLDLDDIAAYPLMASINHTLYGVGFIKLAETNSQGQTTSFEYDKFYRPKLIKNKDEEIVSYQEYGEQLSSDLIYADGINLYTGTISHSGNLWHNEAITFSVLMDVSDATYEWKLMTRAEFETNPADWSNPVATSTNYYTAPHLVANDPADDSDNYYLKVRVSYNGNVVDMNPKEFRVNYRVSAVTLCANRPSVIDLCNQDEEKPGCAIIEGPGQVTLMAEVQGDNGSGDYTYRWYRLNPNTNLATELAVSTTNTFKTGTYKNNTFYVRVFDNQAPWANTYPDIVASKSLPITFSTYQSDPSCNTNNN